MKIPKKLYVSKGALELRMPLTPGDVELGREVKYDLVNNTGKDSVVLASFSVGATESGYKIERKYNLRGQKPVKIGHVILFDNAERVAYNRALILASKLLDGRVPFYDLTERDEKALEEKLEKLERGEQ